MFLQFYGLNEQPFGVTPDPRFLYMGAAQQEAFSSLVYGIETGRGFMALIASPGLGKTTILLRLMEHLRGSARTAFLFQTYRNSEDFLRGLLADLDIEPSGQDLGELQRQLGDALIQEARSGKRIVVAIDEAQNLDDRVLEMIRMLSNFETPESKLLQIVLVGQPQLADKLASPQLEQLRQRVSIITHFLPLEDADIPKYIEHRLRTAGYQGGGLFTPAALQTIVAHSEGIPRNINNLCFQALSLGYAKNQRKIDDATLREVIVDLNLESLGTSPPDKVPLDAVNLSSYSSTASGSTMFIGRRAARGRVTARRDWKQNVQPLYWLALALLLGYLWAGPSLRSDLKSLDRVAGRGGTSSKSQDVATNSALPKAGTGLPGSQTDPVQSQSTPNKDALRTESSPEASDPDASEESAPDAPENPAPVASEETAAAGRGANPVVPTTSLDSSQKSRQPATALHKAPSTLDRGYTPGSSRLIVESNVSGARITINGESNPKWTTPHLFFVASGTYVVSVSRGSSTTWTRRVHVDGGRERLVMAEIEDGEGGIFTVDTDPPRMPVFIDGKSFGPSRVYTILRPGWHVCAVIPEPGHEPLVRRFYLGPGEALTRKIRIGSPTASLNDALHPASNPTSLSAGPQGGVH